MYRFFLSLRFLGARRTNLIGITGIFVGVGALILILSIMAGFLAETRSTMRGSLSDIIVQPHAMIRGQGSKGPEEVIGLARQDPRVAAACPQLQWFGMLTQRGKDFNLTNLGLQQGELAGVQLIGIDLPDEFQTTELRDALIADPLYGDNRVENPDDPFALPSNYRPTGRPLTGTVILGEQLFQRLALTRGSEINILTAVLGAESEDAAFSNRWFVVAGTFRSGENEMDLNRIYLRRSELSDFLGPGQEYDQVLIKLNDYERDGQAVKESLTGELLARGLISGRSGLEVRTWEEFRRILLGAIENEKTLMGIMLSLVLVVAGFTVFAILSMMVTEKRRDIGILCALGATPSGILRLFLMIGLWDALFGAAAGAIAGVWAAYEIDPIERWLSSTFGIEIFDRDVYLFDYIPSVVDPMGVAMIVMGAFICTLLFAALPAWKAARLNPIDALRYE